MLRHARVRARRPAHGRRKLASAARVASPAKPSLHVGQSWVARSRLAAVHGERAEATSGRARVQCVGPPLAAPRREHGERRAPGGRSGPSGQNEFAGGGRRSTATHRRTGVLRRARSRRLRRRCANPARPAAPPCATGTLGAAPAVVWAARPQGSEVQIWMHARFGCA